MATMALRLCCQHLTEKRLSTSSFSRWFNMCWSGITAGFGRNHSLQHPHITEAEGKLRTEMCFIREHALKIKVVGVFFKTIWASFIDTTLPYHVYLLVPLCSGEADDFSRVSLLSCFHGLLDRSTGEEAEVRTELMRWTNSEAPARRQKSGTFVLPCAIHLSRIRPRAWKKKNQHRK